MKYIIFSRKYHSPSVFKNDILYASIFNEELNLIHPYGFVTISDYPTKWVDVILYSKKSFVKMLKLKGYEYK